MKKVILLLPIFCLALFTGTDLNAQYADFSTERSEPACAPLDVWFYNSSDTSGLISLSWDWTINEQLFYEWELPMQTFEAGHYTVVLTLYDQDVPFDSHQEDIYVYASIASFVISTGGEACPGEQLQFWVDDMINWNSMQWTFGDNSIPEDQHEDNYPDHTYNEAGIYDVTLIIDHDCGLDTVIQQVIISETAKPAVHGYITNGLEFCPGDPVIFDVEGEFNAYLWDFGDGHTSTERRPSHVYPAETGTTYEASITVTNSCGQSDTDTVEVTFMDDLPADAGFDYWFESRSEYHPCPGTPVEFDAWGAGVFEWDFGDGSMSNEQKAINYYTEPGRYYITLTVWNGCGDMDFGMDSIDVMLDPSDMPYADFCFVLEEMGGYQDWSDTIYVCPGTLINFVNESYSSSSAGMSYQWDFGDGATAMSEDAFHVYSVPSGLPYPVTMVASNSCGGSDTMTRYVMIDAGIEPDVTPGVVPEIICDGEMVFFYLDEGVEEGRYTFDIDFGDGTFLENASTYTDTILQTIANHVYTGTAGTAFDYVFSITNKCGNPLEKSGTITITDDPTLRPFYYVDNTTSMEGGIQMADWSIRRDPSDHEFLIHFAWPGWSETQDNFGVFFWYDGFDPDDDDMGPANGFVEFRTSEVMMGASVKAYIPIDPLQPPIIGFAVGWSCTGTYQQGVEPEVWGIQLDFSGSPQYSFPLQPNGNTDMSTIGDLIIMGQNWDGICNDERPGRNYYYQLNADQYIQLSLDRDSSKYYLEATEDMEGYDWITDISYGDYSVPETNMIEFIDWGDCAEMMGHYSYSLNGDLMDLFLISDDCLQRVQYLSGSTFIKKPDFGEKMMDMSGCPGDKVLFKIAGGSSYEWHFGDGSPVSNEQYPVHVYSDPGEYDAFVVATNSCGRIDTIYSLVKIGNTNVPSAHFGFDGWDFSRLEPIHFRYEDNWSDKAGNNSYFWEFGDGTNSTLKDPVHAYERNGDYTIRLTVTNSCGSNTSTQMIYIKDAILNCEAKIRIDSVVSRTVYFRDISRGDIINWFWDFGDGFTSAQQDPVHTYDYDGIFFACLSVYDSLHDCAHQVCRQVEIGTQLCIANFTANVNQATNRVQFTDLSTNASEWFWDFGDGNFSDLKDPIHTYTEPGWYYICLSVYDNVTDCFAYRCKELQVGEEDSAICLANFSFFVDEANNSVIFSDESSDNITNWYWTFGDGTFIEDRNPAKSYIGPGIYEVCLIVFDGNTGCTNEKCIQIPVGVSECNLRADFAFFINIETSEVSFNDRSGGKATDWFWNFGDGVTSSNKSPVHMYETTGFYLVTLSVWDENTGCNDHMAEFIQIGSPDCRAAFEYTVDATTRNVQFYNQSTGTLAEYFWYFDDGIYSDEKDPSHQFENPGMYFVSLTVLSDNGLCMDYYFEPIQVGTVDCAARFTYFIDSATNVGYFTPDAIGSVTDYLWFFGDGSISTGKEAVHTFTQPGYFTVGLNTFNDSTGCMDYYEEVILIGRAGQDCRAGFSYISDTLTRKIKFSDRSKGKIVDYIWEFGDGNYTFEQNPEHSYTAGGYFLVCLTVVNDFGIPNTFCDYVQLATSDEERCFAEFFYTIDSITKTVGFVQQSHGSPDEYLWDFGDGRTSTLESPEHIYTDAGYYLVELSIKNSTTNCTSNRFELINVSEGNQGLRAAFSYTIDSSNLKASSYPVDFVGVSLGDAGKLKWTFGDGTSDTITMNPRHEYTEPGIYTACLIISNPITKDADTTCQQVTTPGYTGIDPKEDWNSMIGNFPNPFEHTTYIVYKLPEGTSVDLVLFDQTGRMVDILVRKDQIAGRYRLEYDGSKLDSGVYILRLATGQGVYTARMIVR